jgi:hypothetical protein
MLPNLAKCICEILTVDFMREVSVAKVLSYREDVGSGKRSKAHSKAFEHD